MSLLAVVTGGYLGGGQYPLIASFTSGLLVSEFGGTGDGWWESSQRSSAANRHKEIEIYNDDNEIMDLIAVIVRVI